MSRFCASCGTALNDGTLFCTNCGARVNQQQAVQPVPVYGQPEVSPPPKKKKAGLFIGIAAGVLGFVFVVAAICAAFFLFSVKDYQKPVEEWAAAIQENDADKMEDIHLSITCNNWFLSVYRIANFSKTVEYFNEEFENEVGADYELSVDYGKCTKFTEHETEHLNELLEAIGTENVEIEKAYYVEASLHARGKYGDYKTDEYTFVVVQVDGEWSVLMVEDLPAQTDLLQLQN